MRIGSRLFPYPTLNNNKSLSEYGEDVTFSLVFDYDQNQELFKDEKGHIIKNAHFELTDERLMQMYEIGYIKCTMIVESPATNYRKSFDITNIPMDIHLNNSELKGAVTVSAYLWATIDINGYINTNFSEEYAEYDFDIEKYDIMAIDDGFKFQVEFDPVEDNKMPSIFTIVPKDSSEHHIEYEKRLNNIVISVPAHYYKQYDMIKGKEDWHNVMFGILAIPALAGCISEIKQEFIDETDIDEITGKYKWFRAVCNRYEKVQGRKLNCDELSEVSALVLAQTVLNNATCSGLDYVAEFLLHGVEKEEVDDE